MVREVAARGRRGPGFTVCGDCRAVVANGELVEVVRPGKRRGKWVCDACADRLTEGRPGADR